MIKRVLLGIVIGLFATLALPSLPLSAAEPIEEVENGLQPTDSEVLKAIARAGVDVEYVELIKDYGLRSEGKSPYSRTYADRKSDLNFLEVSQLPMVDAEGDKLNIGWFESGGRYYNKSADKSYNNLFWASVDGNIITLIPTNEQPDGRKQGDILSFIPRLFLDGTERLPKPSLVPMLLSIDPVSNSHVNNTLEWDYGIAKRQVRSIEGRYQGRWIFDKPPGGEILIRYNQIGNFQLNLGQYAINADEELVPQAVFDDPDTEYPFVVDDSATFYPDANPETTSVDGRVAENTDQSWANLIADVGDESSDVAVVLYVSIFSSNVADTWSSQYRSIALFDTSALPDTCTITGATLSIYGVVLSDTLSLSPEWSINVYSSNPDSNVALETDDYRRARFGTTAFCDTAIPYSSCVMGWNDFVFNADGLASISKTSVSKYGFRDPYYDVAENTPSWESAKSTSLGFGSADIGADIPKLVVTYINIPLPPTNVKATSGNFTDKVTITWDKSANATKYEVFRDMVGLGELGDVDTFDDFEADAATIISGDAIATDGDHHYMVSLSLTGTNVNQPDFQSYTAKAGNIDGWSVASNNTYGKRGVGTITYQWQRSAGDSNRDYGNLAGATSPTFNDTTTPINGEGRWFQCVVSLVDASNSPQTSMPDRGYSQNPFNPGPGICNAGYFTGFTPIVGITPLLVLIGYMLAGLFTMYLGVNIFKKGGKLDFDLGALLLLSISMVFIAIGLIILPVVLNTICSTIYNDGAGLSSNYAGIYAILRITPVLVLISFISGAVITGFFGIKRLTERTNILLLGIGMVFIALGFAIYPLIVNANDALLRFVWIIS